MKKANNESAVLFSEYHVFRVFEDQQLIIRRHPQETVIYGKEST